MSWHVSFIQRCKYVVTNSYGFWDSRLWHWCWQLYKMSDMKGFIFLVRYRQNQRSTAARSTQTCYNSEAGAGRPAVILTGAVGISSVCLPVRVPSAIRSWSLSMASWGETTEHTHTHTWLRSQLTCPVLHKHSAWSLRGVCADCVQCDSFLTQFNQTNRLRQTCT